MLTYSNFDFVKVDYVSVYGVIIKKRVDMKDKLSKVSKNDPLTLEVVDSDVVKIDGEYRLVKLDIKSNKPIYQQNKVQLF